MDFDSLVLISAAEKQPHQLSVSYLRKLSHMVTIFQLMVLSCTLFCLAACGPCLIDELQKSTNFDNCKPFKDDYASGFQDTSISDATASYDLKSPMTRLGIKNICSSSHSFCFPSTLPGFSSEEHKFKPTGSGFSGNHSSIGSNRSWFSGSGMFELLNGQTVSCSLNSVEGDQSDISSCRSTNVSPKMNSERPNPGPIDASLSPCVEFMPSVLDYGHKNLYSPSSALLRVLNVCNDSILHVYEPFSTDLQFYHCNFSELHIGPGEVASIGVVFLPRSLGFSQAQLILQTSHGGFLIEVKGYAVESPYKISPLLSLNADSKGRLIGNLSLFNPFDENIYVREVIASLSVYQENASYPIEAFCRVEKFRDSDRSSLLTVKDWLVLDNSRAGFPLMAISPFQNWVIGPQSSESFIEMEFLFELEARVFGAFSVQLARSSLDESDTVLVPVEIDLNGNLAYNGISVTIGGSVSVSLEAMGSKDAGNTVVISLRNWGPHLLSIVEISEFAMMKGFSIKYVQGLLLFSGSVTRVATVTCTVDLCDSAAEMVNVNRNCKLIVLTNDSSSPEIEIPCQDIIHSCLQHREDSTVGFDLRSLKARSGNGRSGSSDGNMWLPLNSLGSERTEADEFILDNWKSQGTPTKMSILDSHELVFPVLQVGTQQSKWITLKNPSNQPVAMQLILNSGQIIDQCKGTDDPPLPISSDTSVLPSFSQTKYGFSMASDAQTEALVHPNGQVSFGPVFFHPSNRCHWTSTALIRNNLSGVEWLTLKGHGGSLSLAIFEGPEPVQSIEFSLGLPFPLNVSSLDMEETNCAFSRSVIKELYAKNTGDLPLTVKTLRVSGFECELDGFTVHNCNGFSLEPGESTRLLVSYQSNFHLESLQRDLELVLDSGVLVIPMKASLSIFMFNVCKESVFWIRLKKFSAVLFLSASMVFLILFCVFPQFSSQDQFFRSPKSSGKPEMESLLKSAAKRKPVKQNSGPKYPNSPLGESVSIQNQTPEDDKVMQTPESLTVKIGKEKNRRRKKRKGVPNSLSGLFEVSSSQSGNSTPSSPLSPASSTPNLRRSESPNADVAANPFAQPGTQTRPVDPPVRPTVKESKLKISTEKKPVLQNSATFPSPGKAVSGLLASTSRVALHARAPGPRTRDPRKVEKVGDEHTYDIWGDHFSGLHLVGNLKDVSTRRIATENSSSSFFVMDPLALVTKNGDCFQEEG